MALVVALERSLYLLETVPLQGAKYLVGSSSNEFISVAGSAAGSIGREERRGVKDGRGVAGRADEKRSGLWKNGGK